MVQPSICAHSHLHKTTHQSNQTVMSSLSIRETWSCLFFVVVSCNVGFLPVVSWCLCGRMARWSLILLLALSLHSQCLLTAGVGCYVICRVCAQWFLRPCVGRSYLPYLNLRSLRWCAQTLGKHALAARTIMYTARAVSFGGGVLMAKNSII